MVNAKRAKKCQVCGDTIFKGFPVYTVGVDGEKKKVCSLCKNSL